jgi:pimeloyl-ACP methyl ester carboxylesterase
MAVAHVNGIDLYYEIHGDGPNLALIEGLGYHSWMWYRQLPAFSQHFRTLVYDNRGVGLSDKPPGPYSHRENAADLAGLLDHLGWERTHVLGVSMGGFIAQEFALAYSDRLDRLVLVATAFGGPNMVPLSPEAVRALTPDPTLSPEGKIRRAMPLAFAAPAWVQVHPDEFEQIVAWRLEQPQPPEAGLAQAMAGFTFDVESRLGEIEAPTLLIAGTEDHVVPPANARLLAAALPHARLEIIPGAGHLVQIEEAERFNRDVIAFLEGAATGEW